MSRLLYQYSVSYKEYLIIPYVFGKADRYEIYSYRLLSAIGHKNQFHKVENPAGICGSTIENILDIAKEHIDQHTKFISHSNYFKFRYIYQENLIIVFQEAGKYFYDHYPPDSLNNIAAPKLFTSEYECLKWIKQGMDGLHTRQR